MFWWDYFFKENLKTLFDEGVTSLVLLAVGISPNLFYYTTYEAAMPHAFNFSLISIFVYFTFSLSKSELWENRLLGVISRTDHAFDQPIF